MTQAEFTLAWHGVLSTLEEQEIFESVRTAAYKIIQGKGATNYAVGSSPRRPCGG